MQAIGRRPLLAALGTVAAPAPTLAQVGYPDRTIHLLAGFAAGGSADVIGRLTAAALSERLGRPVVVENRPGAGGRTAAVAVARAEPDGYTLLLGSTALPVQSAIEPDSGFDPVMELAPIALLADAPNVLVVHPALPVRSVAELVAYARRPGAGMNFGSSGSGTSLHLSGELFRSLTGAAMTHIPYRGSAPALTALASGEIGMMFDSLSTSLPLIQAGAIRPLAVTTRDRTSLLPDVPTMAESGFPAFDISVWFGLFAPRATPRPILDRIAQAAAAYLDDPRTPGRFRPLGMTIRRSDGPDAFRAFFTQEMDRWRAIVASTGVMIQG